MRFIFMLRGNLMEKIRLTEPTLHAIQNSFQIHFLKEDHLWIFGSRVNPAKKGGDIDLYIESQESNITLALNRKNKFINELWKTIGDQKIDVILNLLLHPSETPIHKIARNTGVKLI